MPNPRQAVAQAMYLAQLEACKNSCKCKACSLLRKATDAMSDAFLAGEDLAAPGIPDLAGEEIVAKHPGEE